jgi:large subunit ribosomal protein L17
VRHRVYGYKLGRNKDERGRLFKSLISSLFLHGTIEISEKKAKAIKGMVDRVINLARSKETQRHLEGYINNKDLRERVIKEIIPKIYGRTSGYTSLIKLGTRLGDRTMMVRMSLIGVENLKPLEVEPNKKSELKNRKLGSLNSRSVEKKVEMDNSATKNKSKRKTKTELSKTK